MDLLVWKNLVRIVVITDTQESLSIIIQGKKKEKETSGKNNELFDPIVNNSHTFLYELLTGFQLLESIYT